jgi:hypothetical protein
MSQSVRTGGRIIAACGVATDGNHSPELLSLAHPGPVAEYCP